MLNPLRDFHNYDAYNDAIALSVEVYRLTADFPEDERWELTKQLRRAAVSVPSNIAEGAGRRTPREFARFLEIAIGSLNEVETQVEIARRLGYLVEEAAQVATDLLVRTRQQLIGLTRTLKAAGDQPPL